MDKENTFSDFGSINAISECLSFQIRLHFLPAGSLFKLILCYLVKEKMLCDFFFTCWFIFYLQILWLLSYHEPIVFHPKNLLSGCLYILDCFKNQRFK